MCRIHRKVQALQLYACVSITWMAKLVNIRHVVGWEGTALRQTWFQQLLRVTSHRRRWLRDVLTRQWNREWATFWKDALHHTPEIPIRLEITQMEYEDWQARQPEIELITVFGSIPGYGLDWTMSHSCHLFNASVNLSNKLLITLKNMKMKKKVKNIRFVTGSKHVVCKDIYN